MKDKFFSWLAHKLPRKIVYWALIRAGCYASTGKYSDQVVPDMYFVDVLKRWGG